MKTDMFIRRRTLNPLVITPGAIIEQMRGERKGKCAFLGGCKAFRDLVRGVLLAPLNGLTVKMSKKFLAGLSGEPENAEIGRLIRLADAAFSSTEDCNGCGVCVQVCPVNNISLEEGRPVWHGKCGNCIACFNWCPQKAVETKILQKKYYYRHPKVTVKDLLAQKKA